MHMHDYVMIGGDIDADKGGPMIRVRNYGEC